MPVMGNSRSCCVYSRKTRNIGALIIGIGSGCTLYYNDNEEPPKKAPAVPALDVTSTKPRQILSHCTERPNPLRGGALI